MANIAFAGEKASEDEVERELRSILAAKWPGAFSVNFWSDDGGRMVQAIVECADVDEMLDQEFTDSMPLKFMGWRLVILKVPIGHVRVFYSS